MLKVFRKQDTQQVCSQIGQVQAFGRDVKNNNYKVTKKVRAGNLDIPDIILSIPPCILFE